MRNSWIICEVGHYTNRLHYIRPSVRDISISQQTFDISPYQSYLIISLSFKIYSIGEYARLHPSIPLSLSILIIYFQWDMRIQFRDFATSIPRKYKIPKSIFANLWQDIVLVRSYTQCLSLVMLYHRPGQ